MKPQKQLNSRDCLRASIATLLDLSAKDVPDWAAMEDDPELPYPMFWLEMQSFLKRRGCQFIEIQLNPQFVWMPIPYPIYCLFFGKTPLTGSRHAVVGVMEGKEFRIIFDPLTGNQNEKCENALLEGVIDGFAFLAPMNPVIFTEYEEKGSPVDMREKWHCKTHNRPATHFFRGERCCDPQLGGITLPCNAVKLTGLDAQAASEVYGQN